MSRKHPAVEEAGVAVVAYDDDWPRLYEAEAVRVRGALGPSVVGCEHFGSTAVPGLWAKPIVDILVGTDRSEPPPEEALSAMASLNYVYLGEDGRRPGRFFFRKRRAGLYNVSLMPHGGALWNDNLMFRDYLRCNPAAVRRYSEVKRKAATAYPDSLLAYQNAKRSVVEELKEAARIAELSESD